MTTTSVDTIKSLQASLIMNSIPALSFLEDLKKVAHDDTLFQTQLAEFSNHAIKATGILSQIVGEDDLVGASAEKRIRYINTAMRHHIIKILYS